MTKYEKIKSFMMAIALITFIYAVWCEHGSSQPWYEHYHECCVGSGAAFTANEKPYDPYYSDIKPNTFDRVKVPSHMDKAVEVSEPPYMTVLAVVGWLFFIVMFTWVKRATKGMT